MSRGTGGYIGRAATPGFSGVRGVFDLRSYTEVFLVTRNSIRITTGGLQVVFDLASSPSGYALTTPGYYVIEGGAGLQARFEVWGAGGGGTAAAKGGAGGYASGIYTFGDSVIAVVGEGGAAIPTSDTSAYPDGGVSLGPYSCCGGGSSRVGPNTITSSTLNNTSNTYYLIAGGGGGGHIQVGGTGGAGGGTSGQAGNGASYSAGVGGGGTQSAGGAGGAASNYGGAGVAGSKYKGGDGGAPNNYGRGASGGGGYYGGGAAGTVYANAGGGSGFVNTSVMTSTVLTGGDRVTPPDPNSTLLVDHAGPSNPGLIVITAAQ